MEPQPGLTDVSSGSSRNRFPLDYDTGDWRFSELNVPRTGRCDGFEDRLTAAYLLDPLRIQTGSARGAHIRLLPSAKLAAAGDSMSCRWQEGFRVRQVGFLPAFIGRTTEKDGDKSPVSRRWYAGRREPDAKDKVLGHLLASMAIELRSGNPAGPLFLDTIATSILLQACGAATERVATNKGPLLSPAQLRRVLDRIETDLSGRLSLAELASTANVSVSYLCRAFRATMGTSPHQHLIRRRVAFAVNMVTTRSVSLTEVALASGFADLSQMSTAFRRMLGMTPSELRRQGRI